MLNQGDVECDFCIGRKHKAVKSCLVCLASYCETHLQPHYQSPAFKKHNLVEASTQLQEKICSHHNKLLEVYCRTDQQCICLLCVMDDHKGHDTVSATAERTEKQKQVGGNQQKSQQRIQEREKEMQKLRQAVDSLKRSAQAAVDDSEKIFTELIRSIERRHCEVKELIRAQEKAEVSQAEGLVEQLEQEVAELRKRHAEMEEFSHTEDNIQFLQRFKDHSTPSVSEELPATILNQGCDFKTVKESVLELKRQLESYCEKEADPVTTACGHSYCMGCIEGCWDQDDLKAVYSCPECRQTFVSRPVLSRNTLLTKMVDKLKNIGLQATSPAHCYAEPGDVECDFCIGRKHKAVKSCLVCLASYCETHLQPHYQSPAFKKHNLVEASTQLQEKICSHHNKLLEVYCRTDQQCICLLCVMDDHKGHDTVSATAERTEKQKQVGGNQQKSQQRIQEREKEMQKLRQAVDSLKRSAQAAVDDSEKIFTELIRSIERRHCEVKEKAEVSQAEGLLEQLEQEVAELRKRHAEMEEFSHTEDNIQSLQRFKDHSTPSVSEELPATILNQGCDFKTVKESVSELKRQLESYCEKEAVKLSTAVTAVYILQSPGSGVMRVTDVSEHTGPVVSHHQTITGELM
ncbi:hypothetical protein J4Q44_G00350960 [Coregonus suidteri]|uniref:Uncharacterized protein n=1 Tax=Coregonus suidteri TaxID=861788 RepID=A0AAN8KX84_9TELE